MDFNAVPQIQAAEAARAEYQKAVKSVGRDAFKAAAQLLFDAYQGLEAVRWTQYTPYFNDGEPCTFSVNEVYFKPFGDNTGGDYDDGFQSTYGLKDSELKDAEKDIRAFAKFISGSGDILEEVMGDHVQVTLTRDGIEVEDHDHE